MELDAFKEKLSLIAKKEKLLSAEVRDMMRHVMKETESALTKVMETEDADSDTNFLPIFTEHESKLKDLFKLYKMEPLLNELNAAFEQYLELLNKYFTQDIHKIYQNIDFNLHTVNQIIVSHFYQLGLFDLGESFITEAKETEPSEEVKAPLQKLNKMLADLEDGNLKTTPEWVDDNRDELKKIRSDIDLKLKFLQFVELLNSGNRDEAEKYAHDVISPFGYSHMERVEELLMGKYFGPEQLSYNLYVHSVRSPETNERILEDVTSSYLRLVGKSRSPLAVTIGAGVQALPTLLYCIDAEEAKKQDWQFEGAVKLKKSLELDEEYQFHTIFICPVCSNHSTESNPAMRLPCGHVFCRKCTLNLLHRYFTSANCPMCQRGASLVQCQKLNI